MRKILFHSFAMGDVDDPEIYASQPLWEWQQTEKGQWVMQNCKDPTYTIQPDGNTWGHRVIVTGEVEDRLAVEYYLRWK